jgi:phosphohistidine swiveling domain-containing protein
MLKEIKWKRLWARRYSPYIASSYLQVFQQNPGFDMCKNKLFLPEGNLHAIYFAENEFNQVVKNYTDFLLRQNMDRYADFYEVGFKKFMAWSHRIGRLEFKKMDRHKLFIILSALNEKLIKNGELQFLSFVVLEGAAQEVEREVEKANYDDSGLIMQYISTPNAITKISNAQIKLLRIVGNDRLNKINLQKYLDQYRWIPMYDFVDQPWTLADVRKQIKLIVDPAKEMRAFFSNWQSNLANFNHYFNHLKSGRFKKLVKIVHYFSYLKEMRDDYRRRAYYFLMPFWREIASRLKLSLQEANHLLYDELVDSLFNRIDYRDVARQRQKVYSLVLNKGKVKIYNKDLSARFLDNFVVSTNELYGVLASRGRAKGKVCVVYHQGEFKKFFKGCILVTTMTHPEFLSVMKQTSAIVTDEGGITCHAAIVARELGIPCIIGTKYATKVFKDGDLVEVDGECGVVRKVT